MRVVNRLAALLLGLALIAVGALVVAETVLYLLGRPPWLLPLESWRDRLASTTLADSTFLIVSIVALAVGVLVILAQARPLRPQRLRTHPLAAPEPEPASTGQPATTTAPGGVTTAGGQPAVAAAAGNGHGDWWLTRRSVERRAVRAAGRVWGVYDVKARARGKPGSWRLAVDATGPRDGDAAEVEHAVRDELAALTAPPDVPVSTRLRRGHRRVE